METKTTSDIMISAVMSVKHTDNVHKARMLFKEKGIRHLPVVENNQLKGIVTSVDFVKLALYLLKN